MKGKFENYFVKRRNVVYERAKFNRRSQRENESQQAVIRADRKDKILVTVVKSHRKEPPTKKPTGSGPRQTSCSRCRRSPPQGRQQCPANQAICHKCHKKGNFKHCCRSKGGLREVKQNTDSDDSEKEFLSAVSADVVNTTKLWTITLRLNGRNVEFKVDTRSRRHGDSREHLVDGELEHTGIPLNGPTGEKLDVCGRFTGHLESKAKTSKQEIYVVRSLRKALLGDQKFKH